MSLEPTSNRSPAWWTPDQDSRWDLIKAALRRDWEQTKSDLTGGRKGADLNQHVDDTLGQALGNRPIPPATVPNPMDAEEREDHVRRAAKKMERAAEQLNDDAEKSIGKEREAHLTDTDKNEVNWTDSRRVNAHRWSRWEDAEAPLRYGHAAARHYGSEWDDATELRLRNEWEELHPTQKWDDVRDTVHLGWRGEP